MVIRAGECDLSTDKEIFDHQDRRVSKIVVHPDYYAEGLHNDVALIFTENSFTLQDNINIICLPLKNETYIPLLCYASGWDESVTYDNYTNTIVKNTESTKSSKCVDKLDNKMNNVDLWNILFCRQN